MPRVAFLVILLTQQVCVVSLIPSRPNSRLQSLEFRVLFENENQEKPTVIIWMCYKQYNGQVLFKSAKFKKLQEFIYNVNVAATSIVQHLNTASHPGPVLLIIVHLNGHTGLHLNKPMLN